MAELTRRATTLIKEMIAADGKLPPYNVSCSVITWLTQRHEATTDPAHSYLLLTGRGGPASSTADTELCTDYTGPNTVSLTSASGFNGSKATSSACSWEHVPTNTFTCHHICGFVCCVHAAHLFRFTKMS